MLASKATDLKFNIYTKDIYKANLIMYSVVSSLNYHVLDITTNFELNSQSLDDKSNNPLCVWNLNTALSFLKAINMNSLVNKIYTSGIYIIINSKALDFKDYIDSVNLQHAILPPSERETYNKFCNELMMFKLFSKLCDKRDFPFMIPTVCSYINEQDKSALSHKFVYKCDMIFDHFINKKPNDISLKSMAYEIKESLNIKKPNMLGITKSFSTFVAAFDFLPNEIILHILGFIKIKINKFESQTSLETLYTSYGEYTTSHYIQFTNFNDSSVGNVNSLKHNLHKESQNIGL